MVYTLFRARKKQLSFSKKSVVIDQRQVHTWMKTRWLILWPFLLSFRTTLILTHSSLTQCTSSTLQHPKQKTFWPRSFFCLAGKKITIIYVFFCFQCFFFQFLKGLSGLRRWRLDSVMMGLTPPPPPLSCRNNGRVGRVWLCLMGGGKAKRISWFNVLLS